MAVVIQIGCGVYVVANHISGVGVQARQIQAVVGGIHGAAGIKAHPRGIHREQHRSRAEGTQHRPGQLPGGRCTAEQPEAGGRLLRVEHLQQRSGPRQPLAGIRQGGGQPCGVQGARAAQVAQVGTADGTARAGLLPINDRAVREAHLRSGGAVGTDQLARSREEGIGPHQAPIALLQQAAVPLHHLAMQGRRAAAGRRQLPVETVDRLPVGHRLAEAGRQVAHRIVLVGGAAEQGAKTHPRAGGGEQDAVVATGHRREIGHRAHLGPLPLGDAGGGVDGTQKAVPQAAGIGDVGRREQLRHELGVGMANLVEQGEGEALDVDIGVAWSEQDQHLLGLGGHRGHLIAAGQGLQGHRHGGGLPLLEPQKVLRTGADALQIHRLVGQGLLGADRQGDAAGTPGDHEIVPAGAEAADGGGVVVIAPLVHRVVLHQLARRRPLGGLAAEDQLVVDQIDAAAAGADRHRLHLVDGVLVAGGTAAVQLQRRGLGQGELGAAIAGAGAIAVDGGNHITGPRPGHAHRLPVGAGQVDLVDAQAAAGAAPVLQHGAVGPAEQLARSHAEAAASTVSQHLPGRIFHRHLAVGIHRGDQIRRGSQLLEAHPIPHGEGLAIGHRHGIEGRRWLGEVAVGLGSKQRRATGRATGGEGQAFGHGRGSSGGRWALGAPLGDAAFDADRRGGLIHTDGHTGGDMAVAVGLADRFDLGIRRGLGPNRYRATGRDRGAGIELKLRFCMGATYRHR